MAKLNIRNRNKGQTGADGKPKPANWEYRFEAAKIDGKRRSISKAGFRTKADAEREGAKAMAEYNASGCSYSPSNISYADFIELWYTEYVMANLKPNTQYAYRYVIDNHLKPYFGQMKVSAITPLIVQRYVNLKFKDGLKRNSIKQIMGVLTKSFKYACVPLQIIQHSPATNLVYPKTTSEKGKCKKYILSMDDYNAIIDRFPEDDPYHYAIMISMYTGLRIGEVYGLTWNDVDFKNGTISVSKQMVKMRLPADQKQDGKKNTAYYLAPTKTHSSIRTIPIGKTLSDALRKWKKMQMESMLEYGEYYTEIYSKKESDSVGNDVYKIIEMERSIPVALNTVPLVMRKLNGKQAKRDSFQYATRVIHYELGIEFNFHSLRHTHATMLIESGVSPKTVQMRLGHENIETTLQTYVHDTETMAQEAADVFDQLMNA